MELRLRVKSALTNDGSTAFVIADDDGQIHPASAWLENLRRLDRSTYTIRHYGQRVAHFLNWLEPTTPWTQATIPHIVLWRNNIAQTKIPSTEFTTKLRSPNTVRLWLTAVQSLYEWGYAVGLVSDDLHRNLTQGRYSPPGSPRGGETGAYRQVLSNKLAPRREDSDASKYEWIEDADSRKRIVELHLNTRDRFLIDLLYFTGIRAGEALSLFTNDMHMAGGNPKLGCRLSDPHFHVKLNNDVENGARAKGLPRTLFASRRLIESYTEYVLERKQVLGKSDVCPHVFVNLYGQEKINGTAMSYTGVRKLVKSCGVKIGFQLSGPHIFRHTFATRKVRGLETDPVQLDVVQDILGHRSIESTRIYTHGTEPAMKQALMEIAPRALNPGE